jgi:hypothetical protein
MHNLQFYCVLMMVYADRYKYYKDVPVFSSALCRWNIRSGLLSLAKTKNNATTSF